MPVAAILRQLWTSTVMPHSQSIVSRSTHCTLVSRCRLDKVSKTGLDTSRGALSLLHAPPSPTSALFLSLHDSTERPSEFVSPRTKMGKVCSFVVVARRRDTAARTVKRQIGSSTSRNAEQSSDLRLEELAGPL